jgi:hypothetical protein
MSALDVSAVAALTNKALTQHVDRGAYARAAELYARAAAAAQALRARDCLVLTALQLAQADCWLLQCKAPSVAPAEAPSMVRAAMELLPTALATLTRRKAAGTLLCGACAPHEEAWEQATLMHESNDSQDGAVPMPPQRLRTASAAAAKFVGYRTYLLGARLALARIVMPSPSAPEAAVTRADLAFVCDALEWMAQPRGALYECRVSAESVLAQTVLASLTNDYVRASLDAAVGEAGAQQLSAAWRHVQRSGVLRTRRIEEGIALSARKDERLTAMAAAAAAAKGLRRCALERCGAREVHASQFKLCAACKTVCYCSREHQAAHWRDHKTACKAARGGGGSGSGAGAAPREE